MRSRSVWLLLTLVACSKATNTTTTTAAGTAPNAAPTGASKDSNPAGKPATDSKFQHTARKAVVDTGAVAPPQALVRETYGYSFTRASRDPFRPLTTLVLEGPELPDLQLVNLIYNHTDPKQSLITFLDFGNKKTYTVRPGDHIGRLLLVSADTVSATLRVNDFGTVSEKTYLLRKEDGN